MTSVQDERPVDEDLVNKLRSGELTREAFFEKAWETYEKRLEVLAIRMGITAEEAADVVAETFLSLVKRAQEGDVPLRLTAYLVASVRSQVMLRLRSLAREREKRISDTGALDRAGSSISNQPLLDSLLRDDNASRTAEQDASRAITDAVSKLGDQERALLMLRYLEGASIAQIAEQTKLPYSTVASRLFRSLRMLRERLREGNFDGN